MSEMFNRPVEIYQQGSLKWPTYKFNEDRPISSKLPVIRLSYHGKAHYNSVIVGDDWKPVGSGIDEPEQLKHYRT
jgi:hypothetical protein